jgi:hypothetical protein
MFNHFVLQGWFVAERTKFSLYAALPLIVCFLFDWEEKKRKTITTSILIALTLFILNGEGSLPLFGGLIISILLFIFWYLYQGFTRYRLKELIILFLLTGLIYILLNSYWILPYVYFLSHSFENIVEKAGGTGGVLGWINYISENSSLINLFRLQGIPEWYQNPLHPYANEFLKNPILVVVSFLMPLLAFSPLLFYKKRDTRRVILFFSSLALFSIIFIAGSHPPFGSIYVFLVNFIPGFLAFRTPFYKFAPALWFSYAVLIGFSLNYLLEKIHKRYKIVAYFTYAVFSLGIVLYSYPFLTGQFFDYMRGIRSTRIIVPQYVYEYAKWSQSESRINLRTLMLPPSSSNMMVDAYSWGYWSLSPLSSLFSNASIVNKTNYLNDNEKILLDILYRKMKKNEEGWENLARLLGIQSFVLRKDFAWDLKETPTDNPEDYRKALNSKDIKLVRKIGEWEVYDFKDLSNSSFRIYSGISYLEGGAADIGKISSLTFFDSGRIVYASGTVADNQQEMIEVSNEIFISPVCVYCDLQHKFIDIGRLTPLITRDSLFYPLIKYKNYLAEKKLNSATDKVNYYLHQSLRSILSFDKLLAQRKDLTVAKEEIDNYRSTLQKLKSALFYYLSSNSIDNNFLLDLAEIIRIERKILIRNADKNYHSNIGELLNYSYIVLEGIRKEIDNFLWKTDSETEKKFLFFSNYSGEFELFYRPDSSNTPASSVDLVIDNKSYKAIAKLVSSKWFSLGRFSLSKGLHKLSLMQPVKNLYEGPSPIQISSSGSSSCFLSNPIKGEKNEVYRISFQHRRIQGSRKFFAKILTEKPKQVLLSSEGDILNSSLVWDNYSTDFISAKDGPFYLAICIPPSIDKEEFSSSIEIRDLDIRNITVPDIIFYRSLSLPQDLGCTLTKKSNTEYIAKMSPDKDKTFMVVLNESFDRNWILENTNVDKFTANGYANGWIIKDKKSNIVIKYKVQDFVRLGAIITLISLALALLYLIKSKVKWRN